MPTINPWVVLGALATAIGVYFIGYSGGADAENTRWLAKTETDKRKAVEQALQKERIQQEKVNEALRKQADSQIVINSRLRADLASLRHRPERPANLPSTGEAVCAGANGSQLSRLDAEFLSWESARADTIRAGLAACYEVIDSTASKSVDSDRQHKPVKE